MTINKTCCVTGHREILKEKIAEVRKRLSDEIKKAISDGYTSFIMGAADGTDLLFGELVLDFCDQGYQIELVADIPYRNRLNCKGVVFRRVIARCSTVNVVMEGYQPSCFHARNRDMVQKSSRVIAVYDGRENGGTAYTIRYARALQREVRLILL